MYEVIYLEEVESDIIVAKQWYAEQQYGLDVRFSGSVKKAIEKLLKMPSMYSVRYKNVRIAHTEIFPYNIHYYIDEANSTVVIIGIIHNKRKEALFLDRYKA